MCFWSFSSMLILFIARSINKQRLGRRRVLCSRRQRIGGGLCADAGGGDRGGGVRGSVGVGRGRVQRQRVLQLQQLVVRVQRGGRAVTALVRRAYHVAAVREATHVRRRVVV